MLFGGLVSACSDRFQKFQGADQIILKFVARYHCIEEASLEQKFRTLKAFWQLLADRLLDYPGTCESNQRAGFGDIEVAEHRKAGGHAASSRVGEHTDVRYARVVELPQRGRNFRHLHQ